MAEASLRKKTTGEETFPKNKMAVRVTKQK